jgi:hypothetical protein
MKSRRFPAANRVYELTGGNEDNWLYVEESELPVEHLGNRPTCRSLWVPSKADRELIADGANISLLIVGGQPPVMLQVTDEQPGRGANDVHG